jgi:NADH-quinone oxidoreductase subunit M
LQVKIIICNFVPRILHKNKHKSVNYKNFDMSILYLFVAIPVLMIGLLFFTNNIRTIRTIMVTGATLLLALSVVLVVLFFKERAVNAAEMLFTQSHTWYAPLNITLSVGVDGISVAMLMLSSIIVFTGVFSSWNMDMAKEFFLWYCLLSVGVFGFFITIDLFSMFMFYEVALIPMYLLIGLWGTGRKEYSAMKLTLMLMGGSAFLLIGIIGIFITSGGTTFDLLAIANHLSIPIEAQRWIFPATFLGFGVLGALFPFHTWSPDGHASAPTAVSMLHAGVLMKLGGYGCFRVAIYLMPEGAEMYSTLFLILTGISVVYGAFSAVVQTDLKYINAYSSVSHCGLVLFAILMMNRTAMTGAIMQMLSHGLMTALFFALIGLIYGRTHTRDIREMGGLMKIMPFASVCYVIAGLASLGLPGLSGFVAEMTIFVGSFQNAGWFRTALTIIACCSIVITAVYILRTVGKILYGPVQNEHHIGLSDAAWYEKVSAIGLISAIVFMGFYPLGVSDMISHSLAPIITKLGVF